VTQRVGVDVGGTKCLGVAIDLSGAVIGEVKVPTPQGAQAILDTIVGIVDELGGGTSIGVGLPGLVDRDGTLRAAPNLPGVFQVPFGRLLGERLTAPVFLDNDATCAAVAEWRLGAGRGVDDLMVVTLGTGIGGGVVAGGRLQRGGHGLAGEIGHMTIVSDGRPCGCGRRGCWERYASGSALSDHARVLTGDAVAGEAVVEAARAGDAWAVQVIEVFAGWVALGLANLANVLDPSRFVIGGGLAQAADVVLEPIRAAYPRYLYAAPHRAIAEITVGETGSYAGAVGAALLGDLDR
jgi:glucokinase